MSVDSILSPREKESFGARVLLLLDFFFFFRHHAFLFFGSVRACRIVKSLLFFFTERCYEETQFGIPFFSFYSIFY